MQARVEQFIKDYKVPVIGTAFLVLMLFLLLLLRYVELAGLDNFAKSNPLISTSSNGLISHDQLASLNRDADNAQQLTNTTSQQPKTQNTTTTAQGETTTTTTTTSGSSSTGGSSSSSSGGTTGGNPDTGGGGNTTPEPFRTEIRNIAHFGIPMTGPVSGCAIQHKFTGTIAAFNGPGPITYQWRQSDGLMTPPQTIGALDGDTFQQVEHNWFMHTPVATSAWIDLMIMSPTPAFKRLTFTHQC